MQTGHQLRKESYSSSSLVHRVNSAHADDSAKTHPLGPLRRQSSFDTWISGSPHDSDEYDTDLEENTATSEMLMCIMTCTALF